MYAQSGKFYGKQNLYRDASNLSNVNEVEEKAFLTGKRGRVGYRKSSFRAPARENSL